MIMQIKLFWLIFSVGTVAVLAEKNETSKESDVIYNVWPYPRPGRGQAKPDPDVNLGEYSEYVFGVTEKNYSVKGSLQLPYNFQNLDFYRIGTFFQNLLKQIKQIFTKAFTELQIIETQLNYHEKITENNILDHLQNFQNWMTNEKVKMDKSKENDEIPKEIENCVEEKEEELKSKIKEDLARTVECVTSADATARKVLSDVRNSITGISIETLGQLEGWLLELNYCIGKRSAYCTQMNMVSIGQRAGAIVGEINKQVQKLQNSIRRQLLLTIECRQNFLEDLGEMRIEHSNFGEECASQPLGEDADEEGTTETLNN